MSDLTDIEKGKIYSAAIQINRRKYSADGKYGAYTEIAYEASAAQLGIEALKASGWEIVPADALSTAREEGRRLGRIEGMVWRLIETAPKDGTAILAYFPLEGLSEDWDRVVLVRWVQSQGRWVFLGRAVAGYSDCYQPTHWMPQPAPPKVHPL